MAVAKFKRYNSQNSSQRYQGGAVSVIQELKEKMSRLKFRLLDCQNQNQMLRKELLLAKKVVDKEVSHVNKKNFKDMLNQASSVDFRGRQEKIFLLKNALNELQNRIKQLEEGNVDKTPEDPIIKRKVERPEDHKKYLSRKMIDKELQYLLENSCQLKRKLEVWKKRNVETSKEVEILRLELERLLEKSKEDRAVHESYRAVERDLRAKQTEKLDLRSKLDNEKTRNDQLVKEIAALKEDISMVLNKINDDKMLIEALTTQQGYLHDLLERQKRISENDNRRFRDDLREIQMKHGTNCNMLSHLHDVVSEKSLVCLEMEESMKHKGFVYGFDYEEAESETTASSITTASEQSQQSEPFQQPSPVSGSMLESNEETPSVADDEEISLREECEQYKNILRSYQEEIDQLTNAMSSNNVKLNEWMSQLFQTRCLLAQKNAENRDLEETAKRLQRALSSSKKRGPSPQHGTTFVEEMLKTSDVLEEEYKFLVALWELLLSEKENSMGIYTIHTGYTKKLFVDAIDKFIASEDRKNLDELSPAENEDQSLYQSTLENV